MQGPLEDASLLPVLGKKMLDCYGEPDFPIALNYVVYHLPMYWQQQTGPSCGVSAMNMAKSIVGELECIPNSPALCLECAPDARWEEGIDAGKQSALRVAIASNVSRDGELFCAWNFASIAAKALNLFTVVVEDWSFARILSELLAGYPVIIPYDRNLSNHKPGKSSGSQAHWCVIVGVVRATGNNEELVEMTGDSHQISYLENHDAKLHLATDPKTFNGESCYYRLEETTILICLHAMSNSPFLCSFESLCDSNRQLMTCKTKHYVAPADLVHLRSKLIFISH